MTVITVTTVGYREVHPLSRAGELFTVIVLLGGVGAVLYTFTFLMARSSSKADLAEPLERRRRERMLDELTDHFIICGFGRIGSIIAQRVRAPAGPVRRSSSAIPSACRRRSKRASSPSRRTPASEEVLKRVGIEHARGLIAAVEHRRGERLRGAERPRCSGPTSSSSAAPRPRTPATKLKRAGADRVISPYQIGGLQMAQTALRPAVVDFVQLATSSDNLELNMEQVHDRRRVAARRALARRGESAPALRRDRRRHPARGRPDGVQPAAGHDDARRRRARRARPPRQNCASSRLRPASRRRPSVSPMAARILDGHRGRGRDSTPR